MNSVELGSLELNYLSASSTTMIGIPGRDRGRNAIEAGVVSGFDHALDAANAEATGTDDALARAEQLVNVVLFQVFRSAPR